jgi:uncharacterized glyoxalase superfamily protein PhnB
VRVVVQLVLEGTIEAAEMYIKAFGLTPGLTVKHDDGTYAHLSLMHGDSEVLSMTERCHAINEKQAKQPYDARAGTAGFGIYGLSKDAVFSAYDVLKTDAKKIVDEPKSCPWLELFFILEDKFGVGWQVGT